VPGFAKPLACARCCCVGGHRHGLWLAWHCAR
jgi:hypothetical protein